MDYQKTTEQQPLNRYDQAQRASTSSSDKRNVPYSSSRRSAKQYSNDRYGQYQRATGDSSRSQSSDYSSQRRPTGQSSANQYGQRPSSNLSNQSDRRSELYATSRRPVEQRPADRHGQYQRPMQEGNQRPSAQQSVNTSDRNASAYSPSRSTAEQRPVDRNGQYQPSTLESRPRSITQPNKSSVSNPDSKKVSRNQSGNHHNQYAPDKKIHRKFPVKTIIIGVAALLVLSVFVVIRMKRDGSSISLPTDVPGEAEVTYNYIEDDQIVKKELIGTELTYNGQSLASGTMKYRFKSVTAYDNVYKLCGEGLKDNIDNPKMFKLDKSYLGYSYPDDGVTVYEGYSKHETYRDGSSFYHYYYPSIIDLETGKLRNDCHIFVFEIELINIDAKSNADKYLIKSPNEFSISGMLNLVNRSGEKPYYGGICYFAEEPDDDSDSSGLSYHVIINPGETKTIHLGYFLIGDESEHPYSRMGLADEGHTSTYDDNTVFLWFDMSDVISKENNTVE